MSTIRRIAAATTVALAASGLGVVAAQPASAADPALAWSFSDYLYNADKLPVGFSGRTVADGATDSGSGIVFGGGKGTGSLESGDLDLDYAGSVTFSWHVSITFSDPEVIVDGDGGRIVADVAWAVPDEGSADDVVLTTFDPATATVDGGTFTATPDWSTGSWAPELIAALPSSIQAFFKASGSSSDARKAPATFTSATTAAQQAGPAVSQTTAYAGRAVTFEVTGSGFTAVTQPGDMGVYVGLAPSGGMPNTSSQEDMDKFADSEWVRPEQMADGSFTVTLDPENQYLDPRKSYSIYTWQAHTHSNHSQDTETPVTIDFAKLGTKPKLKAVKRGKSLVVTVGKGAAGRVGVAFARGRVTKRASAPVKKGKAAVRLPKATGAWKAVVTYTPSTAAYRAAKRTVTVRVR
ncbi:hypothetical protein GCM10027062_15310 [Nocardioides hungaricus]